MSTCREITSTLHTPHTTPYTSHTRICLHTSAETRYIHTYDIRIPICTMAADCGASAASEIEVGSIYPTIRELCAAAAKQADTCVAGVAWCGMWRVW